MSHILLAFLAVVGQAATESETDPAPSDHEARAQRLGTTQRDSAW